MPQSEPFDIYSDYVTYWMNHWGIAISFHLQPAIRSTIPAEDDLQDQRQLVGTVRMSNEHIKTLLFNMARTIMAEEERTGATYDPTDEIFRQLAISPEQWTNFWNQVRARE